MQQPHTQSQLTLKSDLGDLEALCSGKIEQLADVLAVFPDVDQVRHLAKQAVEQVGNSAGINAQGFQVWQGNIDLDNNGGNSLKPAAAAAAVVSKSVICLNESS